MVAGGLRAISAWVLAVSLLGLGSGGSAPDSPRGGRASTSPPTPPAAQRADEPRAPDFALETVDGARFRLADQGRPVVLYFMAAWCASCLEEAGNLVRLHQAFGDDVAILVVDVDPTSTDHELLEFRELVGGTGLHWAADRDGSLVSAYAVTALDTTVVIDARARVVYRDAHLTDLATLETAVRQALGEVAP